MAYSFESTQGGGPISKNTADEWTKRYEEFSKIKAHFFGSDQIRKILDQDDCVGMRIYHAMNEKGERQVILIGVRSDGTNIWLKESGSDEGTGGLTGGPPCPPWCPPNE